MYGYEVRHSTEYRLVVTPADPSLADTLQHSSLAQSELYIAIACLFRRFNLELHETVRERDVDGVRDCFTSEPSLESLGVRVKLAKTPVT